MRKLSHGFTIVELLVVIAVIGILSTIGVISFSRYQAGSRDDQRASQAKIIVESLEKYYDNNGEYPSCPMLTQSAGTVSASVLPGINTSVLVTPLAPAGTTNSITCSCLTQPSGGTNPSVCSGLGATVSTDSFAYIGDGSTVCENNLTNASCLQFTLQYREESTGNIISINSRQQVNLLTSGNITNLTATTYSFSQINLGWTAISGATGYTIQSALNSSFTSGMVQTTSSVNSAAITGLTLGTTYYFRVEPTAGSVTGNWSSPIASATTYTLNTPTGSAAPDGTTPASAIDFTWNTVANATSYNVQYSSSPSMTSPTTLTGTTSPVIVSGLSAGTTLYLEVEAIATGYTSGWSTPSYATTTVPVPIGLIATTNSSTQITASWNTVSVATTYTLDYSTDSAFSSPAPTSTLTSTSGEITGITSLSQAVTGLQEGTTFYFRVFALVGSTPSLASSSANATTTVGTPGAPGIQAVTPETFRGSGLGDWFPGTVFSSGPGNYYFSFGQITSASCPTGTYPVYNWSATYSTKPSGAPQSYTAGPTTDSAWYEIRPISPYTIAFYANYYCQGPNSASSSSGTSGASVGH